ncbi:MAG: cupin domain-containing protein [Mycobacterium sp.]
MKSVHRSARAPAVTLLALATISATASLSGAAAASATPAAGLQAVILSQDTVDGIDYITREITIAPGGSTGWHYHDPTVYGVIRSGTLTWTPASCFGEKTYPAGSAVAEASGIDHVHIGRNLGDEQLVMWVSYVAPSGTPPAVEAPDPGCGFV